METNKFDILKKEFSAGFTDKVMAEVNSGSTDSGYAKEVRFLNLVASLAAACILIVGSFVLYNGGALDVESQTGLSQYSDFELNEMELFEEDYNNE